MELSQEIFDQIAGCANMRGDKPGQDRRKARRVPVTVRTSLIPLRGSVLGPVVPVRLRDVSRTGVGLLQLESSDIGGQFFIQLPRGNERPIWAHVVVSRVQPLGAKLFLIGARFERLLNGHPADGAMAAPSAPVRGHLSPEEFAARLKTQETREVDRIRDSILS